MKQICEDFSLQHLSDQKVIDLYIQEQKKLNMLNRFGRLSECFLGYPNTLIMHLCKRELERRNQSILNILSPENQSIGPYEREIF